MAAEAEARSPRRPPAQHGLVTCKASLAPPAGTSQVQVRPFYTKCVEPDVLSSCVECSSCFSDVCFGFFLHDLHGISYIMLHFFVLFHYVFGVYEKLS